MRKITLHDVAKAAGVSVATASWSINDNEKHRIPASTRNRVRKIAHSLGYQPHALGKGLVNGTSDLIGFVTDDVATMPFAGQIIKGARDEAWRSGKLLLIIDTGGKESVEDKALAMMAEQQVQGVIYSTWYHRPVETPKFQSEKPALLVNCFDKQGLYPAIVPDEVQGGRAATELLIKAGHRHIAFVNTTSPSPAQTGRLEGYKQVLEEAEIPFDSSLITYVKPNQEGGFEVTGLLIDSGATAVFCHNDRVAMGIYDGLRQRGLSIPGDMSVVGFDDQMVISAHLHPALTTVGLPHYDLGVLGIRKLLRICHEKNANKAVSITRVKCPPIIRKSISELLI
ncbi:LacI family DNA-binding transcriptional regulator [Sporolactobacillus shoreicorticis]|uniref:LacI family DNA-binding transcriptional regulator n=1 Tax=Sporolactobacillus shoreicorticis TaxID=1923877 RepID=A0ABW5S318_9BACL|nr:LacI family DNA-binding transcriptional regulator [Sporolactobacillus shoreicorticis]MCO7124246.1 LacI family DNA-binding transcriptional regulator [Sporolactobacillus shoreicorticis]